MGQSFWRKRGRKRWTSGARDLKPNCQNGLVSDLVRSPETPSPLMMRMKGLRRLLPELRRKKKRKRKKRRKRRRSKGLTTFYTDKCHKIEDFPQTVLVAIFCSFV